jgi:HEPN domain-containing protein
MSSSLPKQWLDKATEDLTVARLVIGAGHTAHACFLS